MKSFTSKIKRVLLIILTFALMSPNIVIGQSGICYYHSGINVIRGTKRFHYLLDVLLLKDQVNNYIFITLDSKNIAHRVFLRNYTILTPSQYASLLFGNNKVPIVADTITDLLLKMKYQTNDSIAFVGNTIITNISGNIEFFEDESKSTQINLINNIGDKTNGS